MVPNTTGGVGDERWYGFSIFVPSDWVSDSQIYEIVAQWHAWPDFDLGEDWRPPPLAVDIEGDNWRIANRWDPKPVTIGNNPAPEGGFAFLWKGPLDKGIWTDWVVHVRWSYGTDGVLELWKDGTRVVEKHGPNVYNDIKPLYLKIGVYNWTWKTTAESPVTRRVVFVDEVCVADGGEECAAVVGR